MTKKNSKEMIVGKERMKELVLKRQIVLFFEIILARDTTTRTNLKT